MTQIVPPRSEVPVEFTWDAYSIFPNDDAWESEFRAVKGALPGLDRFRGQLATDLGTLADWLETTEELRTRLGKLHVFAHMFHAVDTADQEASARHTRSASLWSQFSAASAFGEPEILAIEPETLKQWIDAERRLSVFRHYFDRLLSRRGHIRSAEVEEVLGMVSEPFSSARRIHSILSDADLTFLPARASDGEEHEIAQGTIGKLLSSPDRELRRTAWENYADAYLANRNTTAGCLATGIKQNVFNMRARRHGSSLKAALSDDHIPTDIFHNLITTFRANLPTWHRYWEIRRRALGLEQLKVYDFKAPLTSVTPTVPYPQSIEWICNGMKPLGQYYVETMRRGLETERWVDVYPNKGKRMGAFSSGSQGTHPFILMSYNNDLSGMSTLAHELGHSMHSYLAWESQPPIYAEYGLFVAEVASNFNQALVRAHLMASNRDVEFQIALIEEAMSNFHRYFFVMPTLARFELEIHERAERGEALTAAGLSEIMAKLFREGFGGKVDADDGRVGITWAQFPTHLYSNFYVYQYATGIAGAHALANRVLEGGPDAAEDYLSFLKAGGSLYPLDALKLAGVDLSAPGPVEETFGILTSYVALLEELVT